MTEKKVVLTYDGLKNMEAELENLKTVRRKDVAEKIKEARGQGDLSENAEYDAAKERFLVDLTREKVRHLRMLSLHQELSTDL